MRFPRLRYAWCFFFGHRYPVSAMPAPENQFNGTIGRCRRCDYAPPDVVRPWEIVA